MMCNLKIFLILKELYHSQNQLEPYQYDVNRDFRSSYQSAY